MPKGGENYTYQLPKQPHDGDGERTIWLAAVDNVRPRVAWRYLQWTSNKWKGFESALRRILPQT